MKRFLFPPFLLLLLAWQAQAQSIPLEVKGDTVQVIRAFPVTVFAPAADLYFWQYDNTKVAATDQGASLLITKAPTGESAILVKMVKVDWTAKKLTTTFGQVVLTVGNIPTPPIPPGPTDPLTATLQAAYAQETDPNKATQLASFAKTYRAAADLAKTTATLGSLKQGITDKATMEGIIGKLPLVNKSISQTLATLPSGPATTALTDSMRQQFVEGFTRVAAALEAVKGRTQKERH